MEQIYNLGKYVFGYPQNGTTTTSKRRPSFNEHEFKVPTTDIRNSPMCTLCRKALTVDLDPRYLDCKHVFCRSCLTDIEYSQVILCTECKIPTILNPSGIDSLLLYFEENRLKQRRPSLIKNSHQSDQNQIPTIPVNEDSEGSEKELSSFPQSQEQPVVAPYNNLSRSFVDVPLGSSSPIDIPRDQAVTLEPNSPPIFSSLILSSSPRGESSWINHNDVDDHDESTPITPRSKSNSLTGRDRGFEMPPANDQARDLPQEEYQDDDFVVVDSKPALDKFIPSHYIPFTQKKELCKPLVNKWLSEIWFAPADLDLNIEIQESRPVYVPFYCFTVGTRTIYSVDIGTTNRSGTTEWKSYHGEIRNSYTELMACATCSVNKELVNRLLMKPGSFSMLSNKILPDDMPHYQLNLKMDESKFEIDINQDEAFDSIDTKNVELVEKSQAQGEIKMRYRPERTTNFICKTHFEISKTTIILLPIYFGSFTYHGNSYELVISGNKGIVEGNRPIGTGLIGKQLTTAVKTVSKFVAEQFVPI